MKLEIQYTEADYREANANAFALSTARTRRIGFLSVAAVVLILILLLGFLWYLNRVSYRPVVIAQNGEPAQDLVQTLLPSSIMAIAFLLSSISTKVIAIQASRKRSMFGKQGYSRMKMGAAIPAAVFFVLGWGVLLGIDWLPVVPWRANRLEAIIAGFAPFIIVLPVMAIVLKWYVKALVGAAWEQKVSLHRPRVLEISNEQVVSSDANTTGIFRWTAFLRFREMENLFVLVTEDALFLMVPKRFLKDHAMLTEFRAMLQTHIKEGYFLTVPQGAFPVVNAATLPPPPPLASR